MRTIIEGNRKFLLIESQDELMDVLKDGRTHKFRLVLQRSLVSRKILRLRNSMVRIRHCIDDSVETLTPDQLLSREFTNIGEAIEKKSFFEECP
ncbi:MAG: hypothetical protein FJ045_05300 [Crenarchaeota archaeon]|nr:hypothetical protein [Thermoproteota archaeon]